jgi:four helix bundle protein
LPSYRDLEVYQEGYRLALEVHQLTLGFPEVERYVLAEQMRRASKSIPANIAEGYGVRTQRNFARFLSQALGSSDEMEVHLDFAKDLGYITEEVHAQLADRYTVLGKRLYRLMQSQEGQ